MNKFNNDHKKAFYMKTFFCISVTIILIALILQTNFSKKDPMKEIKETKCKKLETMMKDLEKIDLLEKIGEIFDFCEFDINSESYSFVLTKFYNTPRWTKKLHFQYYINNKSNIKIDVNNNK